MADSAELLDKAADLEAMAELSFNWANDHNFQVAANVLRHTMDSADAGQVFSGIADAVCHHVYRRLIGELEPEVSAADDAMIVVAYGPFGSRELTYRRFASPLGCWRRPAC